jgi:hypothetical protein
MCQASAVASDWLTKGCHVHVDGVELAVRPDHQRGVVFRAVFSSTPEKTVDAAIKRAIRDCLSNADVRHRWIRHIEGAMTNMLSDDSALRELARGRLREFNFLRIALLRYGA